jgi:xylulokinase
MTCAVGVDVGTTNVKAALVADDGTLIASAHRSLTTSKHGDVAEQDADALWAHLVAAVRELTAAHPQEAAAVTAFGVCTQYSSIVAIDDKGIPVAPMVMWQDQRGTDHCFEILGRDEGAFMLWAERHGIPTIGSGLSLAHILHLQLDRSEVHAHTAAYVEPMDYVTARATGRITASQHSAYMFQLCDNRTLGVTAYDDDLVKLSGVDPTRLPPLVRVDEAVGTLLPAVARELGLPETTAVFAGTNDTVTVAVAAGAFTAGRAGLAIGTTSVLVDDVTDFRVDLEHQLFSMPGPFADRYVVCAENGLGGKVLEHFLQNFVYASDELGDHQVDDAFAALDPLLAATTAGAGGVLFLPWLNGALAPGGDGNIRGGFVHMSLDTTRRDMLRAVVEGIAHNLAWLLPHVETFTGQFIAEVAFVGGAARSRAWCGVLADVLDRPVDALASPDRAVARATALLALQRAGEITRADLDVIGAAERFAPRTEHRDEYAKRQVQFEAAYAALLPISEALQQ